MPPTSNKNRVKKPSDKSEMQKCKRRNSGPGFDRLRKIIGDLNKKRKEETEPASEENIIESANGATLTTTHGIANQSGLSLQSSVNDSTPAQGHVNQSSPRTKTPLMEPLHLPKILLNSPVSRLETWALASRMHLVIPRN